VTAPATHSAWLSARGPRVTLRDAPFAGAQPIDTELLAARAAGAGWSLVELRVHVARRHQIRAHLAALGHPLAGDVLYGGRALPGLTHHFLHASELAFTHPHTGERIHVRAGLPAELQAVLASVEGQREV
jgi:23S rRNA-/tRNA-specific pseudouridylate synthase